tara:strand:- start:835 stop:1266 length:432 start_codon:yes stop_codon:yes gene_type:complete
MNIPERIHDAGLAHLPFVVLFTGPPDTEADESFQYLVDTTSFELPRVRFNYDVSPPPPPPSSIKAYEALVALDPNGFQMVRTRLEEIFPRLSDVATSSVGASVGNYIADYTVTPNQLTRAFLVSALNSNPQLNTYHAQGSEKC